MAVTSYDPAQSVPDLSGRVYFVTGGTTGLGAAFITYIAAKSPAKIFFSGRNKARADELISKLKATAPATEIIFIPCDLADLANVQQAAKNFLAQTDRLDVLMCNAGVMAMPPQLSKDGYEIHFATNHVGHALLIKLLLPKMLETAAQPGSDVRIINLSSQAYQTAPGKGVEFSALRKADSNIGMVVLPNKLVRYGQSKLANLLYAIELGRRYPSITSVSVHPGYVKTDILDGQGFYERQIVNIASGGKWLPAEEGAYSQTWAATTPKENLVNGAYYEPVGKKTVPGTKQAKDTALAKELYDWTEKELESFS